MKDGAEFQGLVLTGIWLLILLAFGKRPFQQAGTWRANAICYMDDVGNQSDGAKKYRRETSYPELLP